MWMSHGEKCGGSNGPQTYENKKSSVADKMRGSHICNVSLEHKYHHGTFILGNKKWLKHYFGNILSVNGQNYPNNLNSAPFKFILHYGLKIVA